MTRILVVDDEPDILTTLRMLLEARLGIPVSVDVANHAEEAQGLLRAGRYDLVLADERMPRMRGSELLAWVAAEQPGTVRVLMTAYAERSLPEPPSPRPHLVLFKPFDIPKALAQLRHAVQAGPGAEGPRPGDPPAVPT